MACWRGRRGVPDDDFDALALRKTTSLIDFLADITGRVLRQPRLFTAALRDTGEEVLDALLGVGRKPFCSMPMKSTMASPPLGCSYPPNWKSTPSLAAAARRCSSAAVTWGASWTRCTPRDHGTHLRTEAPGAVRSPRAYQRVRFGPVATDRVRTLGDGSVDHAPESVAAHRLDCSAAPRLPARPDLVQGPVATAAFDQRDRRVHEGQPEPRARWWSGLRRPRPDWRRDDQLGAALALPSWSTAASSTGCPGSCQICGGVNVRKSRVGRIWHGGFLMGQNSERSPLVKRTVMNFSRRAIRCPQARGNHP